MRSFVPILLSLILGTALSQELLVLPPKEVEKHDDVSFVPPKEVEKHDELVAPPKEVEKREQLRRGLCSPSVTLDSSGYSSGQNILVTIRICASATEWFGLWPAGTTPLTGSSANWQYTCGGKSCASPQNVGTYIFALNGATAGSQPWPLTGSYQVYYLSATAPGIVAGPTVSIGSFSTPITPIFTPINPVPAPAPAPAPSSCTPTISVDKSCFFIGEQITATFRTCGASVEWIGIYTAGSAVTAPALNWQYACVGQSCARAAVPGTYRYGFSAATTGATTWPLGIGSYQIYFHSSAGTLSSSTFTIQSSCSITGGSRRPVFRALWNEEA